jgi:hypothetical protein
MYLSNSIFTGSHLRTLEGGAQGDGPEVVAALYRHALELQGRLGARYLLVRGGPDFDRPPDHVTPTVRTLVSVDRDSDELWKKLNKKARWGVRQAIKSQVRIEESEDAWDDFYRVFARRMRDLGTPVVSRVVMRMLKEHLGADVKLFVALLEGEVIGGKICLIGREKWESAYAAVDRAHMSSYANYLLYWGVIEKACQAEGVKVFDLGRSSIDSGTHQFKQKWRGEDVEILYRYFFNKDLPPKLSLENLRTSTTLKQEVWSRLPLPIANRVGPLLRRQLPFF